LYIILLIAWPLMKKIFKLHIDLSYFVSLCEKKETVQELKPQLGYQSVALMVG